VRYGIEAPETAALTVAQLLQRWQGTLRNRSYRDDLSRIRVHLMPRWQHVRLADVTLPSLMAWIEEMRASSELASGTQRHLLGLLSRALSWAVVNGLAAQNPVRLIPTGARPHAAPAADVEWIRDDETPRRIMDALPEPFDLAFYVAFATGARQGEVFGLHLDDLDDMAAGCIRIRNSYAGPLKEDKRDAGKVKFVPAPADAEAILGPWLERRRASGSGPDDLVFPGADGRHVKKDAVAYVWRKARESLGLSLTWHHATRTSFASRAASRGVPVDQIAVALGHHSPVLTAKHYQKFVRKVFDSRLTLGLTPWAGGKVLPLEAGTTQASSAPAGAVNDAGQCRHTRTEDSDAA
jgi:integrase